MLNYKGGVVAQGSKTQYSQGLVSLNTSISGANSGFVSFVIRYLQYETTNFVALPRRVVSRFVAVSAVANDVKPQTAFIYGFIAAFLYSVLAKKTPSAHIDDPTEVIPVYLVNYNIKNIYGCGLIGIFLSEFF